MNITLIDMAGAGKSFIGKKIAKKFNFQFIDIDKRIMQHAGLTLAETLERLGDDLFIKLEEQTVLQLGDFDNCIISPEGSIVYSHKAMDFLKQRSVIVFLDVPFEVIFERVGPQRGVVRFRYKSLKDLFNERLPLYEKYADQVVCGNRDIESVVEEIIQIYGN